MVCSPRWRKYAKSIGKPSRFSLHLPKRTKVNKNKSEIKPKILMLFYGFKKSRSKSKKIFKAITLCNQLGYNFKLKSYWKAKV